MGNQSKSPSIIIPFAVHPATLKRHKALPKQSVQDAYNQLARSDEPLALYIRELILQKTEDLEEREKIAEVVFDLCTIFKDSLTINSLSGLFNSQAQLPPES